MGADSANISQRQKCLQKKRGSKWRHTVVIRIKFSPNCAERRGVRQQDAALLSRKTSLDPRAFEERAVDPATGRVPPNILPGALKQCEGGVVKPQSKALRAATAQA